MIFLNTIIFKSKETKQTEQMQKNIYNNYNKLTKLKPNTSVSVVKTKYSNLIN